MSNWSLEISLIPESAALCMHGFAMFISFFSLLTHPTAHQYDIQQLEWKSGVSGGDSIIHPSASNLTSVWNQLIDNLKLQENLIACFSSITYGITSQLKSPKYSFII